jgi:hypothetical protein
MKYKNQLMLLPVLLFFSALHVKAQPFNLDENVKPVELKFEEYKKKGEEKAKGRISVNTLTQEQDTAYYFIQGLNMYAPTYFSLNSNQPDADITIKLCKENWKTFHRSGEVKGKSLWKSDFKTEGDFGIMVIANKKPVTYVLMVWTGDELKVEMPSVFKPADASSAGGSGWLKKNMTLVIVAAAAILIIAFLLVKLKKKKS